jgi:hypothetical protein
MYRLARIKARISFRIQLRRTTLSLSRFSHTEPKALLVIVGAQSLVLQLMGRAVESVTNTEWCANHPICTYPTRHIQAPQQERWPQIYVCIFSTNRASNFAIARFLTYSSHQREKQKVILMECFFNMLVEFYCQFYFFEF